MKLLKKFLWLGLGLLALVAVGVGVLAWRGDAKMARRWQIEPASSTVATAGADLAEGERLAQIRGCKECHGADLGGQVLALAPIAALVPPNLTRGQGGVTANYTDRDWQLAIRHGIGPGGRPLILMPSDDNTNMSESDFAALVAYLKSLPPVDRQMQPTAFTFLGRVLLGAGQLPLLTAERIDHSIKPHADAPVASIEQGAYLAQICAGCHRPDFSGGVMGGMPPEAPPAANLTPAGNLSRWTLEQFRTALRTGVRPDGRVLIKEFMPWPAAAGFTDEEIEALYRYFQTLPKVETRQ
ncbi:MAG: c-type cytochrome [Lysobacterales bacterium]